MYFIPHNNKWFNFFAHIKPIYRYGGLVLVLCMTLCCWRFILYEWLDGAITHEQAALNHLYSQLVAQSQAEREHSDFICQLPVLKNGCSIKGRDCIGRSCYDQCSYLFDLARKVGLKVTHYHNEKEKRNSFKQSQQVSIGFSGTVGHFTQFLLSLKQSCRLIQCTSLSVQRIEQAQYNMSCTIQFISPVI